MLQSIREKTQGLFSWIIIGAIAIAFTLFGVGNFFASKTSDQKIAARIEDQTLSWEVVDKHTQRLFGQLAFANNSDPKQLALLQNQTRDLLVRKMTTRIALKKQGLQISKSAVLKEIQQIPQFHENGLFSPQQYLQQLRLHGFTEQGFYQEISETLLLNQLRELFLHIPFVLPSEAKKLWAVSHQRRDFGYVRLPIERYLSTLTIPDSEIKAYYDANSKTFRSPKEVKLAYLKLSLGDFKKQVRIEQTELESYYKAHLQEFRTKAQIKPRHILFTVPQSASPDILAQTQAKAQALYEKLKKGEDFAALAKQHSQDPGSASNGGALGWFEQGQTVLEFEQAAFALSPNEISKPVKSEYGYHIIQLIEKKPEKQLSFDAVKADILTQLKKEKAEFVFSEKADRLASMAFENPESLEEISESLELPILETEFFKNEFQKTGLAAHPKVLQAAFSESVLEKKQNSEVIQLDDETYVVLRIHTQLPEKQRLLSQVRTEIEQRLKIEKATLLAEAESKQLVEKLNSGSVPEVLTTELKLDWIEKAQVDRESKKVSAEILKKVFTLQQPSEGSAKQYTSFLLENGDYVVILLTKVSFSLPELETPQFKSHVQKLTQVQGELEFEACCEHFLKSQEVKLFQP